MGRTIFEVGIANESGNSATVNASGQLAVDASVSIGAVTVGVSGQTVYLAATEVSGTNPFIYLTQSGAVISGIPHKLVVGFSGEIAIAKISGETVTVSNLSGINVIANTSGSTVIGKISGETVSTTISGNVVNVSGNAVRISGGVVQISGQVVNTSGGVSKISGETVISKISGETIIAQISGQTVVTNIDLSGVTLNVDNVSADISGQTVVAEVSGQLISFPSGIGVRISGETVVASLAITGEDISGGTVRLWQGSGHNGVFLTSQSGNIFGVLDDSGRLAVSTSGATVGVTSGTGVRISGETITVVSGTGVRISGETIVLTSGAGVRVSGEIIIAKISGEHTRVSGETFRIWQGSGHNGVYLTNQSGTLFGVIDTSGRLAVTTSGVSVSVVSGTGVRISGETIILTSGAGVRISGETVATTISGNIVTAANTLSGNVAIGGVTSLSGVAILAAEPVKSLFVAYETLMITAASGGTQLLSGDSRVVTIRNAGVSGTSMFVGSSGTNRAPWMATNRSGRGWRIDDGDSLTVSINNPNLIRVVTLSTTSGEPVTYAINNY